MKNQKLKKELSLFTATLYGVGIILGAGIYPLQLLIPVVGIAAALAIRAVFRGTELGRVLLAVAQNSEAARLMGIDV